MADKRSILFQGSSANTPSVATSTIVLAANSNRGAFMIQNQDNLNPLKILFGTGASATVYHMVLKASTAAADGTGGSITMSNGTVYTGVITCFSAGTPSYTVLEI